MTPDLAEFEEADELDELRKANHDLQRRLKAAKAKSADLVEAVFAAAKAAALIEGTPKIARPEKRTKRGREEVALLHATDWQTGKKTYTYDTDVARARVARLAEKVQRIVEIERSDHAVKTCALLLGGDMVENVATFPQQAWEVDSSLFEQMFATAGMLEGLVCSLLGIFERVEVWDEPGNHGRLGKMGDYPAGDNADRMVYRIVADKLAGEKRLTWHSRDHWCNHVEIGNYQALLVHGDEINNFQGQTPLFAIKRKVDAWSTGVTDPFVDCYIGHYHTPFVLPLANGKGRVFGTPSTESDNQFAARVVAASGRPGQRMNMVDPERGRVTTERILWLDD